MKNSKEVSNTPGQRIRAIRSALGMTLEAFGEALGVSHTAIHQRENDKAKVEFRDALAIEAIYGASSTWLLTGAGGMWTDPTLQVAASLEDETFLVRPLIEGGARCGSGGEISDPGPAASRYALRRDFASQALKACGGGKPGDLFFLRCQGESMQPTILDKEIVLLNTYLGGRLEPRNNAIYLVRRSVEDLDARVKRVRLDQDKHQLVLSSDNRQFAQAFVDLDDRPLHQVVLGRVVWVGRYLLETDPPASDW